MGITSLSTVFLLNGDDGFFSKWTRVKTTGVDRPALSTRNISVLIGDTCPAVGLLKYKRKQDCDWQCGRFQTHPHTLWPASHLKVKLVLTLWKWISLTNSLAVNGTWQKRGWRLGRLGHKKMRQPPPGSPYRDAHPEKPATTLQGSQAAKGKGLSPIPSHSQHQPWGITSDGAFIWLNPQALGHLNRRRGTETNRPHLHAPSTEAWQK